MTYQNLGYWIGQANDLSTGSHPSGWTSGQRWSETASEWEAMLGTMTTDRDYWKTTVAHDDPNVWTNRYNAGVADAQPPASALAATAALTAVPASGAAFAFSSGNGAGLGAWGAANFSVSKTGSYVVTARFRRATAANAWIHLQIQKGSVLQGAETFVWLMDNQIGDIVAYAAFNASAGESITLVDQSHSGPMTMSGTGSIEVRFVPTAANPH